MQNGGSYLWSVAVDSAAVFSTQGRGCGYMSRYESINGYERKCFLSDRVRGICPEGWHLPDTTEWKTLYETVGSDVYSLQAKGYDKWPDATDAYGFSARPTYSDYVYFWSANLKQNIDEYGVQDRMIHYAYQMHINTDIARPTYEQGVGQNSYYAIRCVKDSN
jgi:uncharacterized protein (TIGR02145 family)